MAHVADVAQYILETTGEITTIKLQKLVYYCQAWALVWTDAPLFESRIEAWANGPVAPELFHAHQGVFRIGADFGLGDSSRLTDDEKDVVEKVVGHYGDKSSQWLVELTHLEEPWKNARRGALPGERCHNVIPVSDMAEYYSGL